MKYKFENFNAELINPTIENLKASYTIDSVNVQVYATLNSNENRLFEVYLGEMENTDSWGDKTVMEFAIKQLETFKI